MTDKPIYETVIGALAGIRVLDLSRVLAGPWSTQVLGDLGAEVIKVEHPVRGDDTRDWGLRVGDTETAYFNSMNRNKRSITVDLQHATGQALVQELARQCDVVIQNFKLGGAEKMGLGYEQLRALKPDLVYCSISGLGSTGPDRDLPTYDAIARGRALRRERQQEKRDHSAFLRRKVELARTSVRNGQGRPDDAVEADFVARRSRIADEA